MNPQKQNAIKLRKQGLSYKKISKELNLPLSTLASWFKHELWSQDIKAHLSAQVSWSNPKSLEMLTKANRERWKNKHEEYRLAATKEFQKYKDNPLFLAGIMLYWGEGEKQPKSSVVKLNSNDPEMIKIFNLFLTKTIHISPDKISAWLLLYPDLVDSVQKNFWSKATGLLPEQFKKSSFIKSKSSAKRLSYGVCTVTVRSRALKERILTWISLYQNHLQSHAITLEK